MIKPEINTCMQQEIGSSNKIYDKPIKYCPIKGCNKKANYGYIGGDKELCYYHKSSNMINLNAFDKKGNKLARICAEEGCYIFADMTYSDTSGKYYCTKHKKIGSINLYTRKGHKRSTFCHKKGCDKQASRKYSDDLGYYYCASHKKDKRISIYSKNGRKLNCFCIEGECSKHANHGYRGGKRVYCALHKKKGMICLSKSSGNVSNRTRKRQLTSINPESDQVTGEVMETEGIIEAVEVIDAIVIDVKSNEPKLDFITQEIYYTLL